MMAGRTRGFGTWFAAALIGLLAGCSLPKPHSTAADVQPAPDGPEPSEPTSRPAISVIERYIEATGGREAHQQLTSRITHSRFSGMFLLLPLSGEFTTYQKHPTRLRAEGSAKILGRDITFVAATDGQVAWQETSWGGLKVLEGVRRENFIRQADMHLLLRPERHYSRMDWQGPVEFEGVACEQLELHDLDGSVEVRYYDVQTGLLAGFKARGGGGGQFEVQVREYRSVGRILEPIEFEFRFLGGRLRWVNELVEHDVEIDDAIFAPPEGAGG